MFHNTLCSAIPAPTLTRCPHAQPGKLQIPLVSQARPTSVKRVWWTASWRNCVHKLCPDGVLQSRYSILSHDTLLHRLRSISGRENGNKKLGHLFCYMYYWSCKNTSMMELDFKRCTFEYLLQSLHALQEILANSILAGHGWYTVHQILPFLQKRVWLARLMESTHTPTSQWLQRSHFFQRES